MHVYVIVSGLRAQATIIAEAQVLLCSQYKKNNPQCDPIQYAQSILMLFYRQDRLILITLQLYQWFAQNHLCCEHLD